MSINKGPEAIDEVVPGFDSVDMIKRMNIVETGLSNVSKTLKEVRETNSLIVIVLFVGFLALLFTVIFTFIGSINDSTKSRDDLNKSVQELTTEVQVLSSKK